MMFENEGEGSVLFICVCVYAARMCISDSVFRHKIQIKACPKTAFHVWSKCCQRKIGREA